MTDVVERLMAAIEPEDVVLGGGNVKNLKKLPLGCRAGNNANAFLGGFRLWKENGAPQNLSRARQRPHEREADRSNRPKVTKGTRR